MRTYEIHVRDGAYTPRYNSVDEAAAEIRSPEDVTILPGEKVQIRTGIHVRLPTVEHVVMLVPARQMIDRDVLLFDANRLIDPNDQNEIMIKLWNTGEHDCVINPGDVIAKMTVILNSHGSYVTASWRDVVETEIEQWERAGVTFDEEKDTWNFR